MFIPPFAGNIKRPSQPFHHNPQPRFSGFDKKGAFYKAAEELDSALLEAEDTIETEGRKDAEIESAAEAARKSYDTKPYELKFITALAQDVADHFKSWNDPIPKIPAAKMVKNAIAWIVAYRQDVGFDIKEYKPPTKSSQGGYIYRKLLDPKQETIPWPADESEDQKAGWPISKTPIQDLQSAFDAELNQLTQGAGNQRTSAASRRPTTRTEQTLPKAKNKQTVRKAAASGSAAPEIQTQSSSAPGRQELRETANALVQTDLEALSNSESREAPPEKLSFVKAIKVAETKPSDPVETQNTAIQTEPEPLKTPEPLSQTKVLKVAEIKPSDPPVPVETESTGIQTESEPLSIVKAVKVAETKPSDPVEVKHVEIQTESEPLSIVKAIKVAETVPSEPVKTDSTGTQVNMGPRKFTLSPAIAPTSPHITVSEEMALGTTVDDIFDYDVENAFSAQELRNLLKSKPGTQKLYAWFSSEYQGSDPDQKTIAFSRFLRDLRDPEQPVHEDNLSSYLKAEGPASPEPSSETQETNRRKRKASDGSLHIN